MSTLDHEVDGQNAKETPKILKTLLIAYVPILLWLSFIAIFAVIAFFTIEPKVPDFGAAGEHLSLCVTLGQLKEEEGLGTYNFYYDGRIRSYDLVSVGDRLSTIFSDLWSLKFPYSSSLEQSTIYAISPCLIAALAETAMLVFSSVASLLGHLIEKDNKTLRNALLLGGMVAYILSFILAPFIGVYSFIALILAHLAVSFYVSTYRFRSLKQLKYCLGIGVAMLMSFFFIGGYADTQSFIGLIKLGFKESDARLAYMAIIFFGVAIIPAWLIEGGIFIADAVKEKKRANA